ncbi:methyltransferase domain-containing protein [Kocuria sp.]|uniref:methyltransferase domain-containing protein n=1 Tax=Kocuria sp. TaxID=1871328 RepID=UPI0026DAA7D4|nr:methyltransferase domain-containing protein [Kocuria sp.]MDO4919151.1 methyltransferase domain-containing protein [Kocuria sp.]
MTTSPDSAATPRYSHGHQLAVLASHSTRSAADSCAYFLDRLRPGLRILDLGCGPGSITLDLAEIVGPEGQVVGVDFSADAVAAARASAESRGDTTTRFLVADLFAVPVEPGSFDVVHAHQVLQHVPDPVAMLRAMAGYCAPGGVVACRDADYGAMSWYPQSEGLDRWRDTYCAGARALGGEPDAGRRLRAWANAAGLTVESVGSSTWTYADPESARWWGGSQAERVRTSSFAARAQEQGLSRAEVERIADVWQNWGNSPDAWFCMPHGEVVARATV